MNLKKYHRQTLTLERKTGENNAGEPTYSNPTTIKALYRPKSGTKRTITGVEVNVESYVQTTEEIALGDYIEGAEVRRVEEIVYRGRVLGREVFL